ncbi:hypothetical protein [Roseibium aggregatum]|uniref:Uncharacterized protein n=1 Tax=Roseibium aggregatum TaxID=187304 RepID=A0A939EBY2_9HYPH|nr:hypothetical protein [Roseibium aggregatum]MBN9670397.1 hypothetical protein [Roseibium aggregatum]
MTLHSEKFQLMEKGRLKTVALKAMRQEPFAVGESINNRMFSSRRGIARRRPKQPALPLN